MLQTVTTPEPRKPSKSEEIPTLYALARETLRAVDNDADQAEELLFERISSDAKLLRALVQHAVKTSVNVSVAVVLGNQRAAAFGSVANIERAKAGAKALAGVISSSLLDMPLADGTRLRDATAFEINETAERWEKVSNTMAHRARFLRAVAKAVPAGKRVGDVLTEAKASQLFTKAA